MLAIFFLSATYVKASIKSACVTVNGQFHERCHCYAELSFCKTKCNQDRNCKGYVGMNGLYSHFCNIATSSECPSGNICQKLAKGNLGALDKESSLPQGKYYDGCFVKLSGRSIG